MANKKDNKNPLRRLASRLTVTSWLYVATAAVFVVALTVLIIWLSHANHFIWGDKERVTVSPTQIKSIEDIGEWEFLSVKDEELVDTVRKSIFGDSELTRIYYGTLRLGINMKQVKKGWLKVEKDTVVAILPPITLLDENFIDEARTKSFFEEGRWTQADREALYERAKAKMKARCMSRANIESAENNASAQFYKLLRSMGFENVKIRFEKP